MGERCTIRVNGVERVVPAGATLAAAMGSCGEYATRKSVSGEPRGPLCGMGVCFECRAAVDGVAHERACTVEVREGMDVRTEAAADGGVGAVDQLEVKDGVFSRECDVLVVGGGPAGMAAAATAAEHGRRVVLLDDNPGMGGQVWRKDVSGRSQGWRDRVVRAGVRVETGWTVVGALGERRALAWRGVRSGVVTYANMVLATGATELFLPFPGWTLPNVVGVGGLQAMVKGGLEIRGKRVVIAGSGPLLLAVAASLRKRGAEVRVIVEQAPFGQVRGMVPFLVSRPRKLVQGAALKMALAEVDQRYGWWPIAVEGNGQVEAVILTDGRATERIECDYLATGFGLVPSTRIAALLGCRVDGGAAAVNEFQETSVHGVFAAGECTGVGGVDKAVIEGQMAGLMCAGRGNEAMTLGRARDRELAFAAGLSRAFALRAELRDMVKPDTIVCRCEDVRWGQIAAASSWRDAKLQTRCGMGPCQGRVCGPAVSWLTGWPVEDARPPVFNVPLRVLAAMGEAADAGASRERET